MKKMMALLLCLCMAASLAAPAFATADAADTLSVDLESVAAAVETPAEETPVEETPTEELPVETPAPSELPAEDPVAEESNSISSDAELLHAASGAISGTSLNWFLSNDGVLTISGTGAVPDYYNLEDIPWYENCESIVSVVLKSGVTSIGLEPFHYCENLASIIVEEGNSSLKAMENVLFSKDGTILYCYPPAKPDTSYSVPESVTTIRYAAFSNNLNLTTVTIPDSVTYVGRYAFEGCTNLTAATLPSGLTAIESGLFDHCENLVSITLPENITYIDTSAFYSCRSLESINIPDSVTSIGGSAFARCSSLTTVVIPSGVQVLDDYTFSGCNNLKSITLPKSITTIKYSVFSNCSRLTDVYYEGTQLEWQSISIKTGGNSELTDAKKHFSYVEPLVSGTISGTSLNWSLSEDGLLTIDGSGHIPDFGETAPPPWAEYRDQIVLALINSDNERLNIGANTFAGCSKLTSFTIQGAALRTIGAGAFSNCSALTELATSSVTTIGAKAFANCTGLKKATFSAALTTLATDAFDGCSALQTVYAGTTEFRWNYLNGLPSTVNGIAVTYETPVLKDNGTCSNGLTWKKTSSQSSSDIVLTISGTGAIPNYNTGDNTAPWGTSARYLVIEEGVSSIGDYAFFDCSNLSIIWLPKGITSIGKSAFENCSNITTIHLPSTIQTLGADCFKNCSDLESITMADRDDGTIFLGWQDEDGHMFLTEELMDGNTECFYPNGVVTAIWVPVEGGTSGTVKDSAITWSVDMTDGVLTISGTGAMPDFDSLKDVPWAIFASYVKKIVVEQGVTTVGANAFSSFLAVTEVSLADGITSIGESAFHTCTGLTAITLPNTVTTIGKNAFNWCTRLKTVTLSTGLKTIGDGAFHYCKAMTAITLPASLESIGKNAFESCTGLTAIHFPAGLKTIGQDAFLNCIALAEVTMAENSDGDSLTCWIDESGTPYANSQIPEAGYTGALTAFWGIFSDVYSSDWFYDYVMYCHEEGIMQGTNVGIFEPFGGATRAQVVTVLYRLANAPAVSGTSSFTDVPADQWFTDAVIWAAEKGIAKGYGDGTFDPYGYVTREEFLVFLHRFADSMGRIVNKDWSSDYDLAEYGVSDAGSISSWALEAETWSAFIGLQSGYDNGDDTISLNPRGTVTRAELATFLSRYDSNYQLYVNADACQYLQGYSAAAAISVFKGEPASADKILIDDDLEWWLYDSYGIMLLIDYSTNSKGIIVAWDYTDIL